tara:strand:+ start:1432 stop:1677 length:246 start_codon:yes stop_codon:yes gene_type:complete
MLKKFTQHPEDQGETYFEHMFNSWKIIMILKRLELKCFVHSIFPFCYTDALSSKIDCLQKMANRGKLAEEDVELYEVYGGD